MTDAPAVVMTSEAATNWRTGHTAAAATKTSPSRQLSDFAQSGTVSVSHAARQGAQL